MTVTKRAVAVRWGVTVLLASIGWQGGCAGEPARDASQCAAAASAPASAMAVIASAAPASSMSASPSETLAALSPTLAAAHTITTEEALARLLRADRVPAEWFAQSFLEKVPASQVEAIVENERKSLGLFVAIVKKGGDSFTSRFDHGTIPTRARLDGEGRFTALFLGPPELEATTMEDTLTALGALAGATSVLVTTDDSDRAALAPDEPHPVGSTFKLAVLKALRASIEGKGAKKKHKWSDVVALDPSWKSLPSGTLQTWPDKTPLTLQALATMMISASDNTASDALIHVLGRDAIEPFAQRSVPLLTTREVFTLKAPTNADLLDRWRKADVAGKRALFADIDKRPLPSIDTVSEKATALDVEWFFTTRELCALMGAVHDLPLMSVNAGVATRGDWESVAYKGGSEPGVLNLTTWVRRDGHAHCVSATWTSKNETLDETRFFALYGQLLAALHRE